MADFALGAHAASTASSSPSKLSGFVDELARGVLQRAADGISTLARAKKRASKPSAQLQTSISCVPLLSASPMPQIRNQCFLRISVMNCFLPHEPNAKKFWLLWADFAIASCASESLTALTMACGRSGTRLLLAICSNSRFQSRMRCCASVRNARLVFRLNIGIRAASVVFASRRQKQ